MSKSSLEVTDEESKAVQKTEHRVSLDSIKEKVESVEYIKPKSAPSLHACDCQVKEWLSGNRAVRPG